MEHLFGLYITIQVMTVADVSPCHQYAVGALLKCLEDKIGVDPARTHDPDDPHIGRVLKTADARKVSSRICTPVTGKGDDFWAKLLRHENPLLIDD